ncbi:hypothetical protein DFLDMN_001104 [Cupriavidus sp. H19C3]
MPATVEVTAPAAMAHAVMPAWAADVDVPPGPELDERGNLRLTRALRTYYDYFLAVYQGHGSEALERMVYDDIRARVPEPAATQAWQLWQRYRDYVDALGRLAAESGASASEDALAEPVALGTLRAQWHRRRSLRQQYLSDVQAVWFDEDDRYDDVMLDRLDIVSDPTLDAEARARRLEAADARLPDTVRAARAENLRPQQIGERIDSMLSAGHDAQAIAATLATEYGADVAQRYAMQAQQDQAWQTKYAEYARQRMQFEQFEGLSEADRQQALEQLLTQSFASPAEALRAHVHDAASRAAPP